MYPTPILIISAGFSFFFESHVFPQRRGLEQRIFLVHPIKDKRKNKTNKQTKTEVQIKKNIKNTKMNLKTKNLTGKKGKKDLNDNSETKLLPFCLF